MDFVLSQGGSQLRLPVNPAEFTIQSGNQNQTVTVVRRGEINLWGPEQLETVTLASLFPQYWFSGCSYTGFPEPWECVKKIDDWRNTGDPLRLIIVDSKLGVDINMEVLVESFEKGLKGGSGGDVYYSITLKRYKRVNAPETSNIYKPTITRSTPPGLQQTNNSDSTSKVNTVGSKTSAAPSEGDYMAQEGDTLWDIAKKKYGIGSEWTKIFNANRDKLPDASSIGIGQKLTIPF